MKPRPILDLDRDAQIVALWQGRPRDRRRAADIEAFCQWLVDYAPWLVPADAVWREQIHALLRSHIVEGDIDQRDRRRQRRPRVRPHG